MKNIKYLIILAIILGIGVSIFAANQTKKEYTVETVKEFNYHILYKDEKMGVIDVNGNVIIEPKYEYIQLPNPSKPVFVCISGEETKVLNEKNEEIFSEYAEISAIPLQSVESNTQYEKSVLRYKKDNKYGLINLEGDILLKPTYEEITGLKYKEGNLLVKENNKYGVINLKGEKVIKTEYDNIEGDRFSKQGSYKEEGYIVCKKTEEGYKYGYIDSTGKEILKTNYNEITRIVENVNYTDVYLIARKDGQVGLIKNGKNVIEHNFQNIEYDIGRELVIAEKNSKYGLYDLNGKEILNAQYDEILIKGIYILASKGEEEFYYDMQGNKIDNMEYLSVNETSNQNYYITIDNNGLCGIIDKNNNIKVKNEYSYLEYLFEEYFIASKENNKFGIIDDKGNVVVDFKYDVISKIGETNIVQAKTVEENVLDLYNKEMKKVYSKKDSDIFIYENYVQVLSSEETKYFNTEGKEVKNSEIYTENKLLAVQENGKWGFADRQGKIKIECIYDEVTELNEYGFAGVKKDGKWGVIDKNENIIIEPTYELETSYIKPEFIGKYFKQYYDTGEVYYTDNVEIQGNGE